MKNKVLFAALLIILPSVVFSMEEGDQKRKITDVFNSFMMMGSLSRRTLNRDTSKRIETIWNKEKPWIAVQTDQAIKEDLALKLNETCYTIAQDNPFLKTTPLERTIETNTDGVIFFAEKCIGWSGLVAVPIMLIQRSFSDRWLSATSMMLIAAVGLSVGAHCIGEELDRSAVRRTMNPVLSDMKRFVNDLQEKNLLVPTKK
ncbi:MAG: hypothetical protein WC707_00360 [Candidatus Babeliaceae bacterium]|jgi:hypothetical protein